MSSAPAGERRGVHAWMDDGLCAQTDPEAFFPGERATVTAAKKVCRGCDVRAECLAFALDRDERFGVWGGLTPRERRRLQVDDSAVGGRMEVQP